MKNDQPSPSSKRRILVTGAAGFIGAALCRRLVSRGDLDIVGLDNINDYYDPALKFARLAMMGVTEADVEWGVMARSTTLPNFSFIRLNLEDDEAIDRLFARGDFNIVVNLAAQAGVRYSIEHPRQYIRSNVDGFLNVLEGCRCNGVAHLVYASSSSIYGLNKLTPFSEHHPADHPVSLYAATKKSNELMAHVYSRLYGLPTTGLRFFTVYGPWGRPDMSPFLFIDAMLHDRPIKVFNNGDMLRDFTFIDDIVEGVVRVMDIIPESSSVLTADSSGNLDPATSTAPYRIYNIGSSSPVRLLDYIRAIEKALGHEARKEMMPMQPGDVYQTYADSSELATATGFSPSTTLEEGIARTVEWFKSYYSL